MAEDGFYRFCRLRVVLGVFRDLQVLEVLHSEGLKDCLKKWLLVMRLFVMLLIESEGLFRLFARLFAGLFARLFAGPVCWACLLNCLLDCWLCGIGIMWPMV